ncbi:hypothetical protein [Streptomyces sp. NPDC047000]|uniref:hypothetical protein n=1 Tax=Streptomyces sp. NPDC047000 TaxID=3155474 RepID=UPI0033F4D398
MQQARPGAVSPENIRYRPTLLQLMLPVLPSTVFFTAVAISSLQDGGMFRPLRFAVVIWAVVLVLGLATSRPLGIALTPSAAVVRVFRRRTIPWADVQAICVESQFGSRIVVIYEASGRVTRLRAPITGWLKWDRRFEEKFHTIGGWWLDHRGPDWVPVPPPGARRGGSPASDGNPYAAPPA